MVSSMVFSGMSGGKQGQYAGRRARPPRRLHGPPKSDRRACSPLPAQDVNAPEFMSAPWRTLELKGTTCNTY